MSEMENKQHTIAKSTTLSGKGLHTGAQVNITFKPAPPNHGYKFKRIDLPNAPIIHAVVDNVVGTQRGTTIEENGAKMHTVEHTLAAVAGNQIDNILIEVDGPEPPIMDGSAKAFSKALQEAGIIAQEEDREYLVIEEPISYEEDDRQVALTVSPASSFQAAVKIDFNSRVIRPQEASLSGISDFPESFADSRTFVFLHELEFLFKQGLIKGGDLDSAVVIVDKELDAAEKDRLCKLFDMPSIHIEAGVMNNGLRYENEPARHKLLDLVGDLALVGKPIKGKVMATRPGHKANVELAKIIKSKAKNHRLTRKYQKVEKKGVIFDINAIRGILPHRYPFLLVDKITEFSEKTITGVKNVTINEPFFDGHFPGNPIMPGVLQLEAMAQVGGILLLNTIDNPETVWVYIVAIDNARFKKPVIPGDVLEFKLDLLYMRRNMCKMTGKAYVDGELVSSTDMIASIVPKE